MKPKLTLNQYLAAGGNFCPNCHSVNIQAADSFEADLGQAWQEIECLGCEATWNDIYELKGFSELKTK